MVGGEQNRPVPNPARFFLGVDLVFLRGDLVFLRGAGLVGSVF